MRNLVNQPYRIVLVIALVIALFPLKIQCGHIGYTCMPAPDAQGTVNLYYEIEPLGLTLLETLIGTNLHLAYWSGYDVMKVR